MPAFGFHAPALIAPTAAKPAPMVIGLESNPRKLNNLGCVPLLGGGRQA